MDVPWADLDSLPGRLDVAPRELEAGPELISSLGAQRPKGHQLDASRMQRTDDDQLIRERENVVRKKRLSMRVKKSVAAWDCDDASDDGRPTAAELLLHRKPKWPELARRATMFAFPLAALLCLLAYGWFASLKKRPALAGADLTQDVAPAADQLTELEADALEEAGRSEIRERAGSVAEQFFKARSIEERLPFVRDPERVRPLMEHYYSTHPDEPALPGAVAIEEAIAVRKSILVITVTVDGSMTRQLALQRHPDGSYLADWESFIGYCEIPWEDIPTRKATTPFLIRAKVKLTSYYNHGFEADDSWVSWQLDAIGDNNHRLFGYAKRDSQVLAKLGLHTMLTDRAALLTLRVKYPETAPASDQLEITEFVANGWVLSTDPLTHR